MTNRNSKRSWLKVKNKLPPELQPVHLFIDDGEGNFNIATGHHEGGVWLIYDHFEHKFRIYTRQQYVKYWMVWMTPPKSYIKENEKKALTASLDQPMKVSFDE